MLPSPVERIHTFDSITDDVMAICHAAATTVRVPRGQILFKRGDPARTIFVIVSGYARISSISPDGHEVVAAFAGPRDVLGHRAAMRATGGYIITAVAVAPMELKSWTRSQALQLRSRFPAVHAYLDAQLIRNAKVVLERLHTLSEGRAPQRLAKALVELTERHGTRDTDGVSLPVPLTRQDLADLTGTTVYTASRIVSDWVAADILESHRARLKVKRLNRLVKLASA
jgi:CRP/FNR family transcriptional regulator, nitrogen oxide reductase regulator